MKVLNICVNGVYTDGFSYHENLLPKYHKKLGHDVYVIASKYEFDKAGNPVVCNLNNYTDKDGLHTIRLPLQRNYRLDYRFKRFEHFYETIERISPDVIFCHLFQFIDVKNVVKYKKKHPAVLLFLDSHSDLSNSASNWFSKSILHRIIWKHYAQIALPYTERFYGVVPARVDFLADMYGLPRDKIELLVMGADDELVAAAKCTEVRNSVREKYGISEDDFLIVTGGKIDRNKPQTLLLMEAIQGLNTDKIKLIVFGSVFPEYSERFTELLGNNVIYAGWVQATETYKYFNAADLVVFPGLHSVFWEQVVGLGKPCLFKYITGFTHIDLGGNCDFLYEDSAEEIKNKIQALTDDPVRLEGMKRVAETKGMEQFSYKLIAKRSIEVR